MPIRKRIHKTYSIGYLTKTIRAKKIYSDDFDADNDLYKERQELKFKIASVQNSAIKEDSEYSEIENPYFSDNSSSSALTNKLKKFSRELTKNYDKSDNESSVLSFRSSKVGANYKRSNHNPSGLNEPIIEEEEEKEEQNYTNLISETIQKRRKTSMHIDHMKGESKMLKARNFTQKQIYMQSDPIYEEIEVEDEDLLSENNFYATWEQHKKKLLTLDEQAKLMNEDAHSQTDMFHKKPKLKKRHFLQRRGKKKEVNRNSKKILESIEENKNEKDDLLDEEDNDEKREQSPPEVIAAKDAKNAQKSPPEE